GRRSNHETRVLDLGANVDTTAEQLYQFAVMGSVLAEADNIQNPTVGLLNVGEEEIKGNEQVKKTAELLTQSNIVNYVGFVEGNAIFDSTVDVIVCDGFVGNVMLKACEGISRLIANTAKEEFTRSFYTKMGAFFIRPILRRLVKRIDPRRRNGATLIGLNGTVIKSHGSADEMAFSIAIEEAIKQARRNVPQLIRKKLGIAFEGNGNP
ncbi:MAG TPA: phosphate acyltransferase, partial [Coxiellaceae bacterium]|nr:phosphate acyltransferase [Coxiellaceae bacterium]